MAKQVDVIPATEVLPEKYDRALFPDLLNQDPDEVAKRFASQFMRAESIDDLFDVLEGQNSRSMIGKTLQLNGVQWAPYESDRGVIPLAIIDALDLETGEVIQFATTSQMLTLFMRRAEIIGALGFRAKIVEKKTRSGNMALNFQRV